MLHPASLHKLFEAAEIINHEAGCLDATLFYLDFHIGVTLDARCLLKNYLRGHLSLARSLTKFCSKARELLDWLRSVFITGFKLSSDSRERCFKALRITS